MNAASLAIMAVVTLQLGRDALSGATAIALGAVAAALLWRFRVSSAWLVAGGAAVGWMSAIARQVGLHASSSPSPPRTAAIPGLDEPALRLLAWP